MAEMSVVLDRLDAVKEEVEAPLREVDDDTPRPA